MYLVHLTYHGLAIVHCTMPDVSSHDHRLTKSRGSLPPPSITRALFYVFPIQEKITIQILKYSIY